MFAERADAHQRKLALEEIQELRKFVDPERPQHFAPRGDAEIVLELPALLQGIGLIDVVLQVFAVGVHGAQLLHVDRFAVLSQALEADQGPIGGILVRARGSGFSEDEMHVSVEFALVHQFEAAEIEASQHLGFGESPVAAFGEREVPSLQDGQLGSDALEQKIQKIEDRTENRSEPMVELAPALGDRLPVAEEDAAFHQHFVDPDQIQVEAAEIVDPVQIDKQLAGIRGFVLDVEVCFRIEHQGLGLAEAAEFQIVVDEGKKIFPVGKVILPQGNQNAVIRLTERIGWRVAFVADGGDGFERLEKVGGALRFFQGFRSGHDRG